MNPAVPADNKRTIGGIFLFGIGLALTTARLQQSSYATGSSHSTSLLQTLSPYRSPSSLAPVRKRIPPPRVTRLSAGPGSRWASARAVLKYRRRGLDPRRRASPPPDLYRASTLTDDTHLSDRPTTKTNHQDLRNDVRIRLYARPTGGLCRISQETLDSLRNENRLVLGHQPSGTRTLIVSWS